MSVTEVKSKAYSALSEQSEKALITLDKISNSNFHISELPRLKMPSKDENLFTIQTSGFSKKVGCVEGIVVAQNDIRFYWKKEKGNAAHSPVCFSNNCISGLGNPGGDCTACSLARFDPSNGTSNCQQRKAVLILRREDILPLALIAPPKSAKALSLYFLSLASNRIRPCFAVTNFTLSRERNRAGTLFSKINAQIKRLLSEEEKQIIAVYANKFNHLLNAQPCIY
jgi:hypothetical protein